MTLKALKREYERRFKREPALCLSAPGRVNLIGEHTDYNDGYVLPVAIDRYISGCFGPRDDDGIVLRSLDFRQAVKFSLHGIKKDAKHPWGNYPRGVAWALLKKGLRLRGINGVIGSDIPVASGLSSSAALEMLIARALLVLSGQRLGLSELALLGQRAENEFVGVNCGIMDQFIVARAKKGHALMLDCRSLAFKQVPLRLGSYKLVVGNTRKERILAGSAYNERRADCEKAVRLLAKLTKRKPRALRDVSVKEFRKHKDALPRVARMRAEHVIYENERVLESTRLLRSGRKNWYHRFGELMVLSHLSLRYLYEVSCAELDTMVELALAQRGVAGSRMTGAGFGGCTVSLVRDDCVRSFVRKVGSGYRKLTGKKPEFYVCETSDGVSEVSC